jgi:signal recognition particle subunit SRP72
LEVDASEYSLRGTESTKTIVKLNQVLASKSSSLSGMPTSPDSKFTALQTRMYWYNRSVLQLQQKDFDGCRQSCQSLQSTIVAPTKSQQKKNTKKSQYLPLSQDAAAWWNARVDVILAHVEANQNQEQATAKLQHRLDALQALPVSAVRDHALAHVQLHLFHFQTPKPSREQVIQLLKKLPPWIHSKKATVATLGSLTKQGDGDGSSSSDSNDMGMKESAELADVLFAKGDFAQAAKLYEKYLPTIPKCNQNQLQQQARRVQALAQIDPQQATDLWQSLQKSSLEDDNEPASLLPTMDGEALEQQELPRAKSLKPGLLAVPDDNDDTQRKSHEHVLRRRARQREAYLQEQEKKGLFNPSKPTKPNAERWIPKHARSSNRRRGGGGGGYHKGAQGGGSEKEALKLDAAARKTGLVDTGPSTANMKVSSGGRKAGRRK